MSLFTPKIGFFLLSLLLLMPLAPAHEPMRLPEGKDPLIFKDQHDQDLKLSTETQLVLFTADMETYKKVKELFEELKIQDLSTKNWILVADISKMPNLVRKMLALPKMRKLPYRIALDPQGDLTRHWPRQSQKLTLFKRQTPGEDLMEPPRFLDDLAELKVLWTQP